MKTRLTNQNTAGFTLIELLVVLGVLAILLAITIVAINPQKHFIDTRNVQRQNDVKAILDAIYSYEAANKGLLTGSTALSTTISTTPGSPSAITSTAGGTNIDLCSTLAPTFLADLPTDPSTGTKSASTACAGTYNTGYTAYKNSTSGRFTISAPAAEGGATISVTE